MGKSKAETDTAGCLIFPEISSDQVIEFRNRLGLTQAEFAKEFDVPIGTLRRWEQAQNIPSSSRLQLFELKVRTMASKIREWARRSEQKHA